MNNSICHTCSIKGNFSSQTICIWAWAYSYVPNTHRLKILVYSKHFQIIMFLDHTKPRSKKRDQKKLNQDPMNMYYKSKLLTCFSVIV